MGDCNFAIAHIKDNQMNAAEKLRICQIKILNSNYLRLFGCLYYNFDINIIPESSLSWDGMDEHQIEDAKAGLTAAVCVTSNQKPSIMIFEHFINQNTVEELIFVLIHEILHVLSGHFNRGSSFDHEIANLAQDHVINVPLDDDISAGLLKKVSTPKSAFIINELRDKNLSMEEVYSWLIKNSETSTISININGPGNESDSEMTLDVNVIKIKINGKTRTIMKDVVHNGKLKKLEKQVSDNLKAEARILSNSDHIISKGDGHSALDKLIASIIEVEIPWYVLMEKAIASKISPDSDDRSWSNIQKRPFALGLKLPGYGTEELYSTLVIMEDTSGSVSDTNVKQFSSVIEQSMKYFDRVRILQHDMKVNSDITLDVNDVTNTDLIFKIKGRGGTSHYNCFEIVQEMFDEDEDVSLVIMLTDFESDIESSWNKFSWTKHIPVSVILTRKYDVPSYVDKKPILIK